MAKKLLRPHFDSVHDFVEDSLNGKLLNEKNRAAYDNYMKQRLAAPHGTANPTDVRDIGEIANKGWSDGAKRLTDNAFHIEMPRVLSVRRRRVWGDQGDSVDMDKVRAGNLDTAWQRMARAEVNTPPRVRIIVNMAVVGMYSADDVFWRGAACLGLADALSEAGYAVQIISADGTSDCTHGKHDMVHSITVKDWSDPLNIPALAASCCLAGFARTLGFVQIIKANPDEAYSGIGGVLAVSPLHFEPIVGTTFIINPGQCLSKAAAQEWIEDAVQTLQGNVEE